MIIFIIKINNFFDTFFYKYCNVYIRSYLYILKLSFESINIPNNYRKEQEKEIIAQNKNIKINIIFKKPQIKYKKDKNKIRINH